MTKVQILIPVYNGLQSALNCLESVREFAPSNKTSARVLVIDDASPDAAVSESLREFVMQHGASSSMSFELRTNAVNRGFTWNVNQAMAGLRADESLLLLNSDTVVGDGWLDEMVRTTQSDSKIGTVTPFSNNATICSFPDFQNAWPLPSNDERRTIISAMRAERADAIDIPTGVGFCMLMTRACIDSVGRLDIDNFPRGYGEENDFCMRAHQAGFRNVLCPNTYVAHVGGVSFSAETSELMRQGGERLLAKHPHYNALVSAWIAADPAKARRDQLAQLLLQQR